MRFTMFSVFSPRDSGQRRELSRDERVLSAGHVVEVENVGTHSTLGAVLQRAVRGLDAPPSI